MTIDLPMARRIAVAAAGLGVPLPPRADGAAEAIAHLSSVQIDTISVVERAHHHILFSRVDRYMPRHLDILEAPPRRVIEYWSHAAAYLPLEDYRYCIPRMERIRKEGHEWFNADKKTVAWVRDRIRAEGPLRVQDFETAAGTGPGDGGSAGWWDWKPAKVALEYLFHAGDLVSVGREGFQKRYDLAERALPAGLDMHRPGAAEMAAWYLDVATRVLGVFTAQDVAYGRRDLVKGVPKEIAQRVNDGRLVEVALEGTGTGNPWYAGKDALEEAEGSGRARVFILSPFDPLVIDRRRLRRLFGVDYTIECYVPEKKRRFGYFALPLFFRDSKGEVSFAGLVDAKAGRKEGILALKRLRVEGIAAPRRASFATSLSSALGRYAAFNGCADLSLERLETEDPKLDTVLRLALGRSTGAGLAAGTKSGP